MCSNSMNIYLFIQFVQIWKTRAWFPAMRMNRPLCWSRRTRLPRSVSSWRTTHSASGLESCTSVYSSWTVSCAASRKYSTTSVGRELLIRSQLSGSRTTWNEVLDFDLAKLADWLSSNILVACWCNGRHWTCNQPAEGLTPAVPLSWTILGKSSEWVKPGFHYRSWRPECKHAPVNTCGNQALVSRV